MRSHGRRSWWWHAFRRSELEERGEEMGQSREQLWEMVGGVHVGREESAVCIRFPEPIAQTARGEREASQTHIH